MDIRSSGVFGDRQSGGGLFRGFFSASSTAGGVSSKVPGTPGNEVARRETSTLFHDFIDSGDVGQYVVTNITSGTAVTAAAGRNGLLRMSATTANQGLGSVQFDDNAVDNAAAFITTAAGTLCAFEAKVLVSDVSDCDWFVGVGEVDTTFLSNAGALLANGGDNHIGFHHLVADAGVPTFSSSGAAVANVERTAFTAGADYAQQTVSSSMSDATFTRLGFRVVGTDQVEFYVDNKLAHVREMANALEEPLTPTVCMIANGSAITMDVDYILVAQNR